MQIRTGDALDDALRQLETTIAYEPLAAEGRIDAFSELLRRGLRDGLTVQLDPDFLFNALNAIAALLEDDASGARAMTARLRAFLRRAIVSSERQHVTLAEELDLLQAYMEIERVRFGARLQFDVQCDGDARGVMVPALVLLPLVENAVRRDGGRVTLTAEVEGGSLRVEVCGTVYFFRRPHDSPACDS